jgi:hypothetical protein
MYLRTKPLIPIGLAATEQQAPVGGEPVVVDHELGVADRDIVADDLARPRLAQRLGGEDVVVDRHDLAGDAPLQPFQVTVAGEHQKTRPDPPPSGGGAGLGAALDPGDRAVLEDPGAGLAGGAGQAEGVVERVQVAGAAVQRTAVIDSGAQHVGELVPRHGADVRIIVAGAQFLGLGRKHGGIARLVGDVQGARLEVAADIVALDALLHDRLGFLREVPEPARLLGSELALQLALRPALAAAELTAVAPRGAPAGPPCLQQHHVVAPLRQVQRRRKSGKAAADHADVTAQLAEEARMLDRAQRGGGIVGIGMG